MPRIAIGFKRTTLLLAIAVAGVVTLTAQSRDAASQAQTIYTTVMSPFCPGLLLADCPSPAAFELRADIRRRLDAGETADDIERELYRTYGDAIRAVPPPRGWGAVLWIAPAIAFALSLAGLFWFLADAQRIEQEPAPPAPDAAMDERVQDELDRAS